jgi:hypothetical protein
VNVNIKVSIPASLGGYTGQRDAWEEFTQDWNVNIAGDVVTLTEPRAPQRKFKFNLSELNEAIEFQLKLKAGQ